jgi:hypothetical protein
MEIQLSDRTALELSNVKDLIPVPELLFFILEPSSTRITEEVLVIRIWCCHLLGETRDRANDDAKRKGSGC